MLKRSDLSAREQRELNDTQAHLNLAMSLHRKHQAFVAATMTPPSASAPPIAGSAFRRPASLPVLHMPEPVPAKSLCATDYFAESTARMNREAAEGNVITVLNR